MDSARVDSYSRQTYAITKAGNYLVETGTFSNKFSLCERAVDYEGKYIDIWRIRPDGGLQLLSEITGSTKNIDRSDLPLLAFQILDTSILRYRAHESPNNNINAVHICATSLIDAGTYVPEDAYYKGDWPGGGPHFGDRQKYHCVEA
jgi:hypothetical protein